MVSSSSASFDSTQVKNTINNTIKKKTSKGRQKIEIKKIEAKDSRQVTFSKRRTGLFKKAAELCVLTGAKIAILVNSPGGKVYVFDEYDLIDFYLNNINDFVETGQLGFPRNEFSECYGDVSQEMITSSSSNSEEELIHGMDIVQLEEYVCSLEEMKKDAVMKADVLKMNSNSKAMLGSEEMKKDEFVEASDSVVINNSEAMLGSEEMKKDEVVEASDSVVINNSEAMLGSEEMKNDEVVEASDSVVINNSEAMLGSDLPLDMSWMDLDLLDMSWIDSYTDHFDTNMNTNDAFNLNFHHGVEV